MDEEESTPARGHSEQGAPVATRSRYRLCRASGTGLAWLRALELEARALPLLLTSLLLCLTRSCLPGPSGCPSVSGARHFVSFSHLGPSPPLKFAAGPLVTAAVLAAADLDQRRGWLGPRCSKMRGRAAVSCVNAR